MSEMPCCDEYLCDLCGERFTPVRIMLYRFPTVVNEKGDVQYTNERYIIDRDRCLKCIMRTGMLGKAPRLYPLEDKLTQ